MERKNLLTKTLLFTLAFGLIFIAVSSFLSNTAIRSDSGQPKLLIELLEYFLFFRVIYSVLSWVFLAMVTFYPLIVVVAHAVDKKKAGATLKKRYFVAGIAVQIAWLTVLGLLFLKALESLIMLL